MSKLTLPLVEFYINHTCNFNCPECNRFNNYNFSGIQLWEDYKDVYKKWSTIVNLERWAILGGEPLLNPSILSWVKGLNDLWPNVVWEIVTNGSVLEKNKDLYPLLVEYSSTGTLSIGLHNSNRMDEMLTILEKWLQGPLTIETTVPCDNVPNFYELWRNTYNTIRGTDWPETLDYNDWDNLDDEYKKECISKFQFSPELFLKENKKISIKDANNVNVVITLENNFMQSSVIRDDSGSLSLHNSDPIQAHEICLSKYCHTFSEGKLYKCGPVSLFKEFDKQFGLELSDADRQLVNDYQAGSVDMSIDDLDNFINNLQNPIDQCKFCTQSLNFTEIFAKKGNKIFLKKKK